MLNLFMKLYFPRILFFTSPFLLFAIIVIFSVDGYSDAYYIRFATPKQKSLIIGTSRAAQGLQPQIINTKLHSELFNFAFTIDHSPFGKVYFENIKQKLSNQKGGLFIVTVDPWSITSWCDSPNDLIQFRENSLCLNKNTPVDRNPNVEYLLKNFNKKFVDLRKSDKTLFLHQDGWLEINNIPMDSVSVLKRIQKKVEVYRNQYLPKSKFSSVRLQYLLETIRFLKEYGSVYLVRLPIHSRLMEIENEYMPDFEIIIQEGIMLSDGYLDLTKWNNKFVYTDGNHLFKESGKQVSQMIAEWIKQKQYE